MNKIRTLIALLLCACMLLGMTALAEETPSEAELPELTEETVIATVNGEAVTWASAMPYYDSLVNEYGSSYDVTQKELAQLLRAMALENAVTETLLMQKARELGFAPLSEEEEAEALENANNEWESIIAYYLPQFGLTAESTEEEEAEIRKTLEEALADVGATLEGFRSSYQQMAVMNKLYEYLFADIAVTDEEIEEMYQALVAADKELYEDDVASYLAYNNQVDMMNYFAAMYGGSNDMDYAWYKPNGFRGVKHILLVADEELMNAYTDLQARYEEQQSHAEDEAAEEVEEKVTAEQVNAAKAAILAALADKIEEINTKVAEGVDFDELIDTYAVDAQGNPSDPGMTAEPYKTTGYEVCAASSNYVPEFVEAAMSIAELGGVSAPYLSDYGVHIVKYVCDIPGGPVAMTAQQRAAKSEELMTQKRNDAFTAAVESWEADSVIEYTGVVTTYAELWADEAPETESVDAE